MKYLMMKKVYKFFSVITKNSNWEILPKNLVEKMKNFNIFGVHWKIQLLGGFTKNQYRGGEISGNFKQAAW